MPEKGKRTGVYIQCENCGKTVYKTLSQYNKREHHFCSNKCQSEKKRELTFEHRRCEVCGSDMYISKKSEQRFCSTECQRIWQTQQTGKLNPKFAGACLQCDMCGKDIVVGKYKATQHKHHFCSKACRQQWYREVWSQQESWKIESRKRAADILKNNTNTKTKPQLIVNSILDQMSVPYVNEAQFMYYAIDNYLPEQHLAIEVMGDYWHCNVLRFDIIEYHNQADSIRRDKAKRTYMKKYYGIDILYIWEADIVHKRDVVIQLIKRYIDNKGVLENYNSFNYSIADENDLKLNKQIVLPYQEMETEEIMKHIQIAS